MSDICPSADMDDCKSKKKRCLRGDCAGQAYTQGNECPAGYDFDPDTCLCTPASCFMIYGEVDKADGFNVDVGVPCTSPGNFCANPSTLSGAAPFRGYSPQNLGVESFYSPSNCGYRTRGALFSYSLEAWCDGRTDGILRTFSVTQYSTDWQPTRARLYIIPFPTPAGCENRECWTLVASATNNNGTTLC